MGNATRTDEVVITSAERFGLCHRGGHPLGITRVTDDDGSVFTELVCPTCESRRKPWWRP